MRANKTEKHVRVASTGHAEGDMLGQVLLWIDKRQNSKLSQRPHRKKLKGYTFMSRSEVARMIQSGTQTAPTACLRSLNILINKGKVIYTRVVNRVRKLFVNS